MSVAYDPRWRARIHDVDPAEVRTVFLRGGYRALERSYGTSNEVIRQLIAIAGGPALLAERQAVQKCGRKAGGAVPAMAGE